jgi:hypothetical protein
MAFARVVVGETIAKLWDEARDNLHPKVCTSFNTCMLLHNIFSPGKITSMYSDSIIDGDQPYIFVLLHSLL